MVKDAYRNSRVLSIIEAALEYFVAILISGAYLAKVTSEIGLNDRMTALLTALVQFGYCFQLCSLFITNNRPVKGWITILNALNMLFFAAVYVVPFITISTAGKGIVLAVFLLLAYFMQNVASAPKLVWTLSLVDDNKRGDYTANKEIVSLVGGVIFSFLIGLVIDYYDAVGDVNSSFLFCGIGILGLTVIHTVVMLFMKEKPRKAEEKKPIKGVLLSLLKDKNLFKIMLISVLWNVAYCATIPFYGTYQIKELGFTMTFVSILSVLYTIFRSVASKPLGKYADKHSFSKMLNICFIIHMFAFAVNIFTVPANGMIFYTLYHILSAVAMAGINGGLANLLYGNVEESKRVGAIAVQSVISGLVGFLTTYLVGLLVEYIQGNDNTLFGIPVYAQQVVSLLGVVMVAITLLYMNTVVKEKDKKEQTNEN